MRPSTLATSTLPSEKSTGGTHAATAAALRGRRAPTCATASMRGLSSSVAATTTTARYYGDGGGERPPPRERRPPPNQLNRNNAAASAASTTLPQRQQQRPVPPISRQQQQQFRPIQLQQQQQQTEPPRAFLARSDVVDKQVIARTSGRCLGVVDHMLIDAETMRVSSVELRAKGLAAAAGLASAVGGLSSTSSPAPSLSTWGARPEQQQRLASTSLQRTQRQQLPRSNLPLATLCQVGDVVLVHDERALSPSPSPSSPSSPSTASSYYYDSSPPPRFVRLTGSEVVAADGARLLGRVRGYGFDPETGELLAIRYDALGSPRVPEGAMVVVEVPVSAVLSLDQSQQWGDPSGPISVVLRPGADEDGSTRVVSEGLLGLALAGLQALWEGGDAEREDLYDELEDGRFEGAEAFGRGLRRGSGGASSAAAPPPSSSSRRRVRRASGSPATPDPEFDAWRQVHGRVFASYYGLPSVPRTRSELDAAMASAASAPAGAGAATERLRQQRQQQQRAALPPPSTSSFGDALLPATERGYYETVAFDDVAGATLSPARRARGRVEPSRPPTPSPPSSWPPPPASSAEEAFWREQSPPPPRQQQRSPRLEGQQREDAVAAAEARWGATPPPSRRAPANADVDESDGGGGGVKAGKPYGIPIIDMKPKPPAMIRDADGGFGGASGAAAAAPAASSPAAAADASAAPKAVVSEISFGAPPSDLSAAEADRSDGSSW